MSQTLFIADLHLSENQPAVTAGFLTFLEQQAAQADALYILGDLFEFWIGDDDPNPLHDTIAQALAALNAKGVPCYFIHGNRDFLIGKRFAQQSHITLLPMETVIEVYGQRILIMHGDELCTDDPNYLRFRKIIRHPLVKALFLTLPLCIRLNIANKLRHQSQLSNRVKSSVMMDVNQLAVINKLTDYHVQFIVHGHTHRPNIHDMTIDGKPTQRIVLGAWHHAGSVLIIKPNDHFVLENFRL